MTDSPVTRQLCADLSIDQQLALRTAATRLHGEFDGTFGLGLRVARYPDAATTIDAVVIPHDKARPSARAQMSTPP